MKLPIFVYRCSKVLVFILSVLIPSNTSQTQKQDVCSKRGEICLEVNNCDNGRALVNSGRYVSCSVRNFVPGICCKNAINASTRPSQKPSSASSTTRAPIWGSAISSNKPTATAAPSPPKNTRVLDLQPSVPQQTPTKSSRNSTAVALENCKKYTQYKYVQRWKEPDLPGEERISYLEPDCVATKLIVNGLQALPKEYPHMALMGYGKSFQKVEWNCGGSLISENFILSAAHCSTKSQYGAPKWALLGDLDISTNTDDARPAVYSVTRAYDHPNYDHKTTTHDIALFRLNTTVKLSAYVRPACLYTSTFHPVGTQATITGWGLTETASWPSNHLLKATIAVAGDWRCTDRFQGYNKTTMICAGDLQQGKDTCSGDSGGPLQLLHGKESCIWDIIGVTSYGDGICGNKEDPSVFTNVAYYLDWIQSIVWP